MENHIQLIITSKKISSDQITKMTGLSGDKTWSIGEKREESEILETENGLMIKSRLNKNNDIEAHIKNVMHLTDGTEGSLKKISELPDCEIQLSCVIYCDTIPPLTFEKNTINWISDIGASLDIDIYSKINTSNQGG